MVTMPAVPVGSSIPEEKEAEGGGRSGEVVSRWT
jgi:hypothetical protein